MKRGKFIKHLEAQGCPLHRHGSRHDIYKNEQTGKHNMLFNSIFSK